MVCRFTDQSTSGAALDRNGTATSASAAVCPTPTAAEVNPNPNPNPNFNSYPYPDPIALTLTQLLTLTLTLTLTKYGGLALDAHGMATLLLSLSTDGVHFSSGVELKLYPMPNVTSVSPRYLG